MPVYKSKTRRSKAATQLDAAYEDFSDLAEEITLASVPDKRNYTSYISRQIDGRCDLDYLDYAFRKGANVLLYGPTGPGKTSFAMAWAAYRGMRFYSSPSNIAMDPTQMFGKMSVKEDGTFGWFDGGITDVVRHGGVIHFGEVNFMSERITPVVYPLLDKRREITLLDHKNEVIRAHRPDCWCSLDPQECRSKWILIMADMNPNYAGTRPLNFAFRNRFPIQLDWGYDDAVEEQLVPYPTLLSIARNIRAVGPRIATPVATNMLQEFASLTQDLGLDFAIKNFCNHFDVDERAAVEGVFDSNRVALEEDFKPDEAPEWDQFDGGNDEWMQENQTEDEDEAEAEPDEDYDWSN